MHDFTATLQGLRVLVVEDEVLVALLVESMLSDMGCRVVGPAGGLDEAFAIAAREPFDLAVLDVNLAGERVDPFVDLLKSRGSKFLFATGYGVAGLREEDRCAPVLQKPFDQLRLGQALAGLAAPGHA